MIKRWNQNLLYLIIAGSVLGAVAGIYAPEVAIKSEIIGTLFLNALKLLVVPLIVASMTAGVASLGNIKKLGREGLLTLVYYITTTFLAVLVGIILVNIIQPGRGIEKSYDDFPNAAYNITPRPLSGGSVVHLASDEKFRATSYPKDFVVTLQDQKIEGYINRDAKMTNKTVAVSYWMDQAGKKVEPQQTGTGIKIVRKAKSFRIRDLLLTMIPENIIRAAADMQVLPLIIFSLLFGGVLTTLGDRGKPVIDFFIGLNAAVMSMVHLLMLLAPIGIFALVAYRLGSAELTVEGGFIGELTRMGKYAFTVIIGLLIHGLITLPLILRFFGKRKPAPYARNMGTALFTAFSTASSAATLPLTMQGVVDENKVSERTASFVLPIGATINMDGTAMYEAVAALFIAQVYGIHLEPMQQVLVFIMAVLAGVGAAAIPEAGLVTMVLVLTAVGLPTDGIAIILAIDWFLDRCRTTVNVWGDAVGAGVIEKWIETSDNSTEDKSN